MSRARSESSSGVSVQILDCRQLTPFPKPHSVRGSLIEMGSENPIYLIQQVAQSRIDVGELELIAQGESFRWNHPLTRGQNLGHLTQK